MKPRVVWGARFVLLATAGGVVLFALAMHLYPGGTAMDPGRAGHSFWLNFLCDLMSGVAQNGVPNVAGSLAARAALLAMGLALGIHFLAMPALLDGPRALARAIRVVGALCAAGLIMVPFAHGPAHAPTIFASAGAGLVAGILTLIAEARGPASERARRRLLGAAVALVAADSLFYAQTFSTHPRVVLPQVPIFQRLACLLVVLWMAVSAAQILARAPDDRHARS